MGASVSLRLSSSTQNGIEPEKLTSDQAKAIENLADAISIPKSTHKKSSRTYGGRNTSERVNSDAADLNAALENDLDEILKDLEKTDPECAKNTKKLQKNSNKDR